MVEKKKNLGLFQNSFFFSISFLLLQRLSGAHIKFVYTHKWMFAFDKIQYHYERHKHTHTRRTILVKCLGKTLEKRQLKCMKCKKINRTRNARSMQSDTETSPEFRNLYIPYIQWIFRSFKFSSSFFFVSLALAIYCILCDSHSTIFLNLCNFFDEAERKLFLKMKNSDWTSTQFYLQLNESLIIAW